MKVTKVTRNEDYVRFSLNMEMESEGLKVKTHVNGGLSKVTIANMHDLQIIEDPDFDHEFSLFGESVKYSGFQETYSKLFNKEWDDFIEELDELANEQLRKEFPRNLYNISDKDRLKCLEAVISNLTCTRCTDGNLYYTKTWLVHSLLSTTTVPFPVVSKGFTLESNGIRGYGMKAVDVDNNVQVIKHR